MTKKNIENSGKKWTSEDISKLKKLASKNTPTGLLAYELKRTESSVMAKASQQKISLKPTNQKPYDRNVSEAKKKEGKK